MVWTALSLLHRTVNFICHAHCSTCAQPVEPRWVDTTASSHTFCVQKHLSALSEKMLVFLKSLPWVIEGKYGGWNIYRPSRYLLLPPSQYPSHIYSPCPIIYTVYLSIYLFLSLLTSHQCKVLNNRYTILTCVIYVFLGGMFHSASVNSKIDAKSK